MSDDDSDKCRWQWRWRVSVTVTSDDHKCRWRWRVSVTVTSDDHKCRWVTGWPMHGKQTWIQNCKYQCGLNWGHPNLSVYNIIGWSLWLLSSSKMWVYHASLRIGVIKHLLHCSGKNNIWHKFVPDPSVNLCRRLDSFCRYNLFVESVIMLQRTIVIWTSILAKKSLFFW